MISQGSRGRRRPRTGRWLALGVAGLALFAFGVALGEALHDNPRPGGTTTYVRTLHPLRMAPSVQARTVTVTATS